MVDMKHFVFFLATSTTNTVSGLVPVPTFRTPSATLRPGIISGLSNNDHGGIVTFTTTSRKPRRPPPSSSSSTRLHSSSSSSSTPPRPQTADAAQAGEAGYSLLRQPLTWDSDTDPTFTPPTSLDEQRDNVSVQNKDWFDNKIMGNVKIEKRTSTTEDDANKLGVNAGGQRKMEFQQELDLFQRTLDTLDYPIVLNALKDNCGTIPAKQIVDKSLHGNSSKDDTSKYQGKKPGRKTQSHPILTMGLTASDVHGVHERYQAVKEMKLILSGNVEIPRDSKTGKKAKKIDGPVLNSDFDIEPMMEKVDNGGVLDGPEILDISSILRSCVDVSYWCSDLEKGEVWNIPGLEEEKDDDDGKDGALFRQLPKYGESIFVDDDLLDLLESAFDDEGRLSGTTFQGIGRLRAKVRTLKKDVLSTLDTLMSSPSVKNKLSLESGGALYSEVNGRIVIPISEQYKNSVGIVHDVSRSGKTSYIEPSEVVGPTNEMNQAMMELKQEENKVWRMLTNEIMDNRDDIERSIAVVAQLDLVLARIRLADRISGVIPQVGDEGVISLKNAKHPVLLLRELENVVGSDIDIGADKNQGLVLTGPNSGGKTVILKLLGLCALMARDGIPIPANADNPRVDFFGPVLADIGDLQSVDEDLSTFSGHMLVCREVLVSSGQNALVLMDELGSGTDPNQGVAIAQSILEALLETGSRVAITTHYLQLKQLATSDNRFSVGAMQFVNGRPTYKLLPGVVGESFALSVAERLNMPQHVIDRATELMDSDTKQMGDLIRNMEDQKLLIDQQADELEKKRKDLDELEQQMIKQKERLEREQVNARRIEAEKFAKKLKEKEVILEEVLQTLKSNPSKKMIAKSWDEIKYVKRDAFTEAENVPSVLKRKEKAAFQAAQQFAEMVPLAELRQKPDIKAGDRLVICKKGPFSGKEAVVINAGGKRIDVTVSGMPMTMKLAELALPPKSFISAVSNGPGKKKNEDKNAGMSKMARKALADEEADIASGGGGITVGNENKSGGAVMRLSSNTVDCLGCNFEEARRKCEDKFSKMMMSKNGVVYILHGHGTKGVLKTKIRDWLKREKQWVKKWSSADTADGGDAFTKVELKNTLL